LNETRHLEICLTQRRNKKVTKTLNQSNVRTEGPAKLRAAWPSCRTWGRRKVLGGRSEIITQ